MRVVEVSNDRSNSPDRFADDIFTKRVSRESNLIIIFNAFSEFHGSTLFQSSTATAAYPSPPLKESFNLIKIPVKTLFIIPPARAQRTIMIPPKGWRSLFFFVEGNDECSEEWERRGTRWDEAWKSWKIDDEEQHRVDPPISFHYSQLSLFSYDFNSLPSQQAAAAATVAVYWFQAEWEFSGIK